MHKRCNLKAKERPAERSAYDFLLRATSKRDRLWKLLVNRRQVPTLLCVVQWVQQENAAKPFSLAEVSLTETAVCWRDYATTDAECAEMGRRCEETASQDGTPA